MGEQSAEERLEVKVRELGDWRGGVLAAVHAVVLRAEPAAVLAWKWVKPTNPGGVAVWEHGGGICTGEVYKDKVKLTFHRGASLPDPAGLFNSSLDGNVRRAIDIRQGEVVDEDALVALVRAAVAANASA